MGKKGQANKKAGRAGRRSAEERGRARRGKSPLFLGGAAAIVIVVGGYYFFLGADAYPGQRVPSLGNQHISPGADKLVRYNSDPPTSGPHDTSRPPWGIHPQPIPKGLQIHALEDGGVIVHYGCQDCPEVIQRLQEIVARYPQHVILAPYPDMKTRLALTAWGRMDAFDELDERRVVRFIDAYRGIDHHR